MIPIKLDQEFVEYPQDENELHDEMQEHRKTQQQLQRLQEEIQELHQSFRVLNTIVETQEEDIENIHENVCMTTKAIQDANQELEDASFINADQRFTRVSLGAMTGVLLSLGMEFVLPGSGLFGGAIVGGVTGFFMK